MRPRVGERGHRGLKIDNAGAAIDPWISASTVSTVKMNNGHGTEISLWCLQKESSPPRTDYLLSPIPPDRATLHGDIRLHSHQ